MSKNISDEPSRAESPVGITQPPTPSWRLSYSEKPEPGHRIIALYDDGSGGQLFYVHAHGLVDSEGDEREDLNAFSWWAYLPSGFRLWCELRDDDPCVFPADGSASDRASDAPEQGTGRLDTQNQDPHP